MGADIHLWVEILQEGRWVFAHAHRTETWEDMSWIDWDSPYNGRNYALFALLANVRNSGARIVPISFPRGMPTDLSDIGRQIVGDEDNPDQHSHSWFSLEELLEFDWAAEYETDRGYAVPEEVAEYLDSGHAPSGLKSSPSGRHTQPVEKSWTFAQVVGAFHDELLPMLASLGDPDKVRIVFFFDN